MKNNDALKKHHFWILFGLVPLFILIAVLTISSSVGGEIEKRTKTIEDEKGKLAKLSNPKSGALMDLMDGMIKKVDGKRGSLWKSNWDRQVAMYTWPRSEFFKDFIRKEKGADGKDAEVPVRIEDLKFGETIWNTKDQYLEFKKPEFYQSLYSTVGLAPDKKDRLPPGFVGMADSIAPTQFNGRLGTDPAPRHRLGSEGTFLRSDLAVDGGCVGPALDAPGRQVGQRPDVGIPPRRVHRRPGKVPSTSRARPPRARPLAAEVPQPRVGSGGSRSRRAGTRPTSPAPWRTSPSASRCSGSARR